jgi:magnesium-transporting ATPase (P-type)
MNMQQQMEERLWDYMDGTCSIHERSSVEKLLENNPEWKAKYYELMEVQQLMQSAELESPSMRFSKNVMDEISKLHIAPATKTYIDKKIIWGLGIFFIALLVGFLIYGFGQVDWNAKGNSTIAENLNKVNFSRFFSNTWVNIFMMVNVVLGLFLLDNYLSNKRKAFKKA